MADRFDSILGAAANDDTPQPVIDALWHDLDPETGLWLDTWCTLDGGVVLVPRADADEIEATRREVVWVSCWVTNVEPWPDHIPPQGVRVRLHGPDGPTGYVERIDAELAWLVMDNDTEMAGTDANTGEPLVVACPAGKAFGVGRSWFHDVPWGPA